MRPAIEERGDEIVRLCVEVRLRAIRRAPVPEAWDLGETGEVKRWPWSWVMVFVVVANGCHGGDSRKVNPASFLLRVSDVAGGQPGREGGVGRCGTDLYDREERSWYALLYGAGIYSEACELEILRGGGIARGGEEITSVVIVSASPAGAARAVRKGTRDILYFFGFAGRSEPIEALAVPKGLGKPAVGKRWHGRFPPEEFSRHYVGVAWRRGPVIGMVQIGGANRETARELGRLARIQDRRMSVAHRCGELRNVVCKRRVPPPPLPPPPPPTSVPPPPPGPPPSLPTAPLTPAGAP